MSSNPSAEEVAPALAQLTTDQVPQEIPEAEQEEEEEARRGSQKPRDGQIGHSGRKQIRLHRSQPQFYTYTYHSPIDPM